MKIVQKENPVLRRKAKDVPISKIKSPEIKKVISDMKKALLKEDDGVAIAAPQIGESHRIFVVSGKVFDLEDKKQDKNADSDEKLKSKKNPDLVFINPKMLKLSKKKAFMPEGCLSVRWLYGEVKRSTNVSIEAYDDDGKKFTRGAGGLLAQIFQHEIDHLDGVLFIDSARNIVDLPPEKNAN